MAEMRAADPALDLLGHGVNAVGREADNALAYQGRTLAWLQDQAAVDAWGSWQVTQRDCVVLDALNRVHAVLNLTANDLNLPENYDALRALVLSAAAAPP